VSNYKYDEPGVMTLKAQKLGIDYAYTYAFGSTWPRSSESWFVRGEVRYASGKADYASPISGSMGGKPNAYLEARALLGKDLGMGTYLISPYAGLGLRRLHSDLRGPSSTGAMGYRRDNDLTYALFGASHRFKLTGQAQLHTSVEYLHLVRSTQGVRRTDASPLLSDLSLRQKSGHGLRLQVMRLNDRWSFGPILSYWQIDASETAGSPPAFEPKNKTYEFGLKATYQF